MQMAINVVLTKKLEVIASTVDTPSANGQECDEVESSRDSKTKESLQKLSGNNGPRLVKWLNHTHGMFDLCNNAKY